MDKKEKGIRGVEEKKREWRKEKEERQRKGCRIMKRWEKKKGM